MTRHNNSELDRKLRDISVMYELVSSIGTSLDMDVELNRFLQKLLKRFGYSLGAILISNKESGSFTIKAACGFLKAQDFVGMECTDDHFGIADVVRRKEPFVKNVLRGDERNLIINSSVADKIKSLAFFPILFEEEVFGILRLFSFSGNSFPEKSVRMIIPLVNRLGTAINHIKTVKRLRDTEESLRRSEERFKSFFDNANDAIFVQPLSREDFPPFVEVNNTACRRYGYSKEEFLQLSTPDIVKKDHAARHSSFEQRKKLLESGHLVFEAVHCKKSGEEFPVEINTNIINQGDGRSVILSIARDATLRIQMENALRESEAQLRTLIKTIPDLVWLKDPDGVYLACNPKFERFFGAPESEIVGKTDHDFVDRKLADFFREKDKIAMAAGKPSVNEEEVTYADDGHREMLETIKTPMYGSNGSLIGVLGIARDITERKDMESLRQQTHKMEAIATLTGGIAHDFNNILSGILGYAELIGQGVSADSQIGLDVKKIIVSGSRAADLVRQLLAYSRKTGMEKQHISPHLIINEAVKRLRATLPKSIAIEDDIDHRCGTVLINPTNLQQVILNLCSNASQSMPDMKGIIRIGLQRQELSAKEILPDLNIPPGPFVVLTVSDTGSGIDKEITDRIFEPYFTTKERGTATSGLGLAVVYGIIQDCRGFIEVESTVGKGSRFLVYFPVSQKPV